MFLSLNFVLNILLRMSVISLQFSFKNLSFRNLSVRGSRTREEILGSSSGRPGGAGARAATDGRAAGSVSDQEVGEARSGKGSREVVLNTFLIFRGTIGEFYARLEFSFVDADAASKTRGEADKSIGPW